MCVVDVCGSWGVYHGVRMRVGRRWGARVHRGVHAFVCCLLTSPARVLHVRPHAQIASTLSSRPCIVLNNNHQVVSMGVHLGKGRFSLVAVLSALGFAATLMLGGIVLVGHPSNCNARDVVGLAGGTAEHCGAVSEIVPALHVDKAEGCAEWAASDECTKNPDYMLDVCALSCKAYREKWRLLVIRTNRVASTAFGGWILRAVEDSHGRLEAYRADDGEVARTGVTAWAAHANAVLQHRTMGPLPEWNNDHMHRANTPPHANADANSGGDRSTLIVVWIRSPVKQFASAYGSFKSSGMGHYGESVSDTLRRPPQPENWRLDNMNARSLGWGPLVSGAWGKKLTPAQERHSAGLSPQSFVAQVEREVDLVLINDHMVESLVMLRRALGFSASALHSALAMLKGINAHLPEVSGLDISMTPDDMERVCSDTWSSVDCALFEHFNASLWAKVEAGGEGFAEEVRDVRHHWSTLDKCCENNSCATVEQMQTCDDIRESARHARIPIIVQF